MTDEDFLLKLESIEDEGALRKMWLEEENAVIRRYIRSRMFQLRESRLLILRNDYNTAKSEMTSSDIMIDNKNCVGVFSQSEDVIDSCAPAASPSDIAIMKAVCNQLIDMKSTSRPSSSLLVHGSNSSESENSDRLVSPRHHSTTEEVTISADDKPTIDVVTSQSNESTGNSLLNILWSTPLEDVDLELHDGEIIASLPATDRGQTEFARVVWQFCGPSFPCCAELNQIVNEVELGSVLDLHESVVSDFSLASELIKSTVEGYGGKLIHQYFVSLMSKDTLCTGSHESSLINTENVSNCGTCKKRVVITGADKGNNVDVFFSGANTSEIEVVLDCTFIDAVGIREALAKSWGFTPDEIDFTIDLILKQKAPNIGSRLDQNTSTSNTFDLISDKPKPRLESLGNASSVNAIKTCFPSLISTKNSVMPEKENSAGSINASDCIDSQLPSKHEVGQISSRIRLFEQNSIPSTNTENSLRRSRRNSLKQIISVRNRAASWERAVLHEQPKNVRSSSLQSPVCKYYQKAYALKSTETNTKKSIPENISVSVVVKTAVIVFREVNTNKVHEFCLKFQSNCPTVASLICELEEFGVRNVQDLDAFVARKSQTNINDIMIEVIDSEKYRRYRRTVSVLNSQIESERSNKCKFRNEVDGPTKISTNKIHDCMENSMSKPAYTPNQQVIHTGDKYIGDEGKTKHSIETFTKKHRSPVKCFVEKIASINTEKVTSPPKPDTNNAKSSQQALHSYSPSNVVRRRIDEINARAKNDEHSKMHSSQAKVTLFKKSLNSNGANAKTKQIETEQNRTPADVPDSPYDCRKNINCSPFFSLEGSGYQNRRNEFVKKSGSSSINMETAEVNQINNVRSRASFFENIAAKSSVNFFPKHTMNRETKKHVASPHLSRGYAEVDSNKRDVDIKEKCKNFETYRDVFNGKWTESPYVKGTNERLKIVTPERCTAKQVVSKVMLESLKKVSECYRESPYQTEDNRSKLKENDATVISAGIYSDDLDCRLGHHQRNRQGSIFDDPSLPIPNGEEIVLSENDHYSVSFGNAETQLNPRNQQPSLTGNSVEKFSPVNDGINLKTSHSPSNAIQNHTVGKNISNVEEKPRKNFLRRVSFIGEKYDDIRSDASICGNSVSHKCCREPLDKLRSNCSNVVDALLDTNVASYSANSQLVKANSMVDGFPTTVSSPNHAMQFDINVCMGSIQREGNSFSEQFKPIDTFDLRKPSCSSPISTSLEDISQNMEDGEHHGELSEEAIPSYRKVSNFTNLVFSEDSDLVIDTKSNGDGCSDEILSDSLETQEGLNKTSSSPHSFIAHGESNSETIVSDAGKFHVLGDDEVGLKAPSVNHHKDVKFLHQRPVNSHPEQVLGDKISENALADRDNEAIDRIHDHRVLEKMIDRCDSYEKRLRIRARIRQLKSQ